MKDKEEGWMKPTKHVPLAYFYKKLGKSTENDKNSNRCDGFSEDIEIENAEYEEESVKQKQKDVNFFLYEADSKSR